MEIRHLSPNDVDRLKDLLKVFGEVFHDSDTYTARRPSNEYLCRLLDGESFIALVALEGDDVVGGLAAYELKKFEQERSEIYLYDLAVDAGHRREGLATALIEKLREIATERGAHVIFVQADTGAEDKPAIALYTKLGRREHVLHFDIAVQGGTRPDRTA